MSLVWLRFIPVNLLFKPWKKGQIYVSSIGDGTTLSED
jgi:hypothetical protein